jgi:hypothetical protein
LFVHFCFFFDNTIPSYAQINVVRSRKQCYFSPQLRGETPQLLFFKKPPNLLGGFLHSKNFKKYHLFSFTKIPPNLLGGFLFQKITLVFFYKIPQLAGGGYLQKITPFSFTKIQLAAGFLHSKNNTCFLLQNIPNFLGGFLPSKNITFFFYKNTPPPPHLLWGFYL